MIFNQFLRDKPQYDPIGSGRDSNFEESQLEQSQRLTLKDQRQSYIRTSLLIFSYALVAIVGFAAGALYQKLEVSHNGYEDLKGVAQRIPLPRIKKQFMNQTAFLDEPPQGEGSGNISEPIWDSLVPNGLGYFKDGQLASRTSIPTVFHQLHCLYIIRRAYYQDSDDLQDFDFGKDRDVHVPHCLDYLRQGLTCNIDTTVEPAVEKQGEFLGFGFDRQCQDFEALKAFVEEHRMFDASGFLAAGLDHGHAHLNDDKSSTRSS